MDQASAVVRIIVAVGDAICDLGSVPSGELYTRLSSAGMDIHQYQTTIAALKRAGLVKESNYLLTWIGPKR